MNFQVMFSRFGKLAVFQPLFGLPKGEIGTSTSMLGCSRGQYVFQTRHCWEENVQNYHTFASNLIPPQMGNRMTPGCSPSSICK